MKLREVLDRRGSELHSVHPDSPLLDAMRSMTGAGIGSLVVRGDDDQLGIVTERDCLRALAKSPDATKSLRVREVATPQAVTVSLDASLDEVVETMSSVRCRHLPVLDDQGQPVAMVSARDVLQRMLSEKRAEVEQLVDYITHG